MVDNLVLTNARYGVYIASVRYCVGSPFSKELGLIATPFYFAFRRRGKIRID